MFEAGHWMFSRTLSHMSEARAWMHLPGHPSALAVLVTEPRKPAADHNINILKVICPGQHLISF